MQHHSDPTSPRTIEFSTNISKLRHLGSSINLVKKKILGINSPGRDIEVYPDDIFLTSYPKSGNTWGRFLIANLIYGSKNINFSNIDALLPDIYKTSKKQINKLSRPRVIKSHEYLDIRYRKVIYLVRDPRDVLISFYHYKNLRNKISKNETLEDFSGKFLNGQIDKCGSWREHVGGWLGARGNTKDFILVKYEDMLLQPLEQLRKISHFLEIQATDKQLDKVISLSSFDHMKKLEVETGKDWGTLKSSKRELAFVRKGKSGEWINTLPPSIIQTMNSEWGDLMLKLGYQ